MPGRWEPAARWFGLHVDLGDYHTKRDVWLHHPAARFTCRWGCAYAAAGAAEVAQFTRAITAVHARECPGPPKEDHPV
ncbi:hypothetical protein JHN59_37555 [Streptomyces sp. MBT49]|uniref:hypothetical protein n=1 Tax=Streptomyces sp. MBT49 TaxID=1488380 RepID=UPI00190D88AD|nr:hypothetical protein [Streptomyces sp. MBT49]MBK3630409.1 hypothetical protein [Streptomyces sp. MBT49]